ncbi:MAG: aldehyde ferredoxin oxidoreductase family protein [Candidatus Hodarchaeales archaeon]|jgi:aldehyde:ferredoxin oxidoreductase
MNANFNPQFVTAVIDLTTSKTSITSNSFNDSFFSNYLGGIGSAAEFLLRNMSAKVDPLGPDNYLCFLTGVLSGTNAQFSGRFTVVGKSPLTGTWGEANSGGRFGPELKKAGIDLLFIKGRASELSILYVNDGKIQVLPSSDLKSLDCVQTEEKLKGKYGPKIQVASIGMAGEKKVLISGIVTDKGRIAARCGLGAVMGSKNLKAIVVRGTQSVPISDPQALKDLRILFNKRIKKGPSFLLKPSLKLSTKFAPWLRRFQIKNYSAIGPTSIVIESYRRWGTAAGTSVCVETGDSPVKNWNGCFKDFPLDRSVKLTADNVTQYRTRKYACKSCPLACGGIVSYTDDRYSISNARKPEFETLAMLGPNLLNDDLGSIIAISDYCNKQGLDVIEIGSILGFLMEAIEKRKVSKEDLDGLHLSWGNSSNIMEIIQKIVSREGIGNILADGLGNAAKQLDAEEIAIQINNQAIPAHDPRFMKSMIIPYKLDPAPGRHTPFVEALLGLSNFDKMFPSLERENRVHDFYCYHQVISSIGLCQFGLVTGNLPALEFTNIVTGLDLSVGDFITIGERILTLKHLFNLREGINPLNFRFPPRILSKAKDGPNKDVSIMEEEEKEILGNFLGSMKWDKVSTEPDLAHLKELGLEAVINDLKT